MKIKFQYPRKQIAIIMDRIYRGGMTTTSGGNISVLDSNGDIWITPAAIDKGALDEKDIVCVRADGTTEGLHRPSSEFPFHRAIYGLRPDLRALIHAHPPALVAFSIARKIPNTNVISQAKHVCGAIGYAPYRLPGSEELGGKIAESFNEGYNAVIMENHGTVVGGSNLFDTYQRFETLEFASRTIIKGEQIGTTQYLSNDQTQFYEDALREPLPKLEAVEYPPEERAFRADICKFVKRACRQRLMISTYGTISRRWRGNDFLITPTGFDRLYIKPKDVVQIRDGRREPGKYPSRAVRIHQAIYERHPGINSIIFSQPPNAMAFSVTGRSFDTRTIPESWILLQDIPRLPFGEHLRTPASVAATLGQGTPMVLIANDSIVVTGSSLLETFDRLEVAEFSARSLIEASVIGQLTPIGEKDIEDLRRKFLK